MRKKAFLVCLGIILLAVAAQAQLIDPPAAKVSLHRTEVITVKQLQQQLQIVRQAMGREPTPEERDQVLDAAISEILIQQAAEQEDIRVSDSEVEAQIDTAKQSLGTVVTDVQFRALVEQNYGLEWEEYREQVRNTLLIQKYVRSQKSELLASIKPPTETQIRRVYNTNSTQFVNPEMVRYSHVFISTQNLDAQQKQAAKDRAEEIYREIRNGETTFNEAVVKYSDDTNSRYKGGDVGYLPRNNPQLVNYFGETFVDTLFELEVGETSDVVTSNLGYHIIRKTEHLDKKFLDLDDPLSPLDDTTVREGIRQQLMQQAQAGALNQAVNEVVADLREKADITVYEDRISW